MKNLPLQKRTIALVVVLLPLMALFVYVALRSGPFAPVPVTVTTVEKRPIAPSLFGIGSVDVRYSYKIGPVFAGRIKRLDVHVGDRVKAGQVLGKMDAVDLNERIRAQKAALGRADAQVIEARARLDFARKQATRYEKLLEARSTSEEIAATRKYELDLAKTGLEAAKKEFARTRAELGILNAQLYNLQLITPVDGLVTVRNADPGTTVVAGQSVVELIDPSSLWVSVRFDQVHSRGLKTGQSAQIVLRSKPGELLAGRVLRVEPLADTVTEEILAKVQFDEIPEPLPPVGELAEVTVALPTLPSAPVIPNASIQRIDGELGVWQVKDGGPRFTLITLGAADLNGHVQIHGGLETGDHVIVFSQKALSKHSRLRIVDSLQEMH